MRDLLDDLGAGHVGHLHIERRHQAARIRAQEVERLLIVDGLMDGAPLVL
jgi:hypothetical protein